MTLVSEITLGPAFPRHLGHFYLCSFYLHGPMFMVPLYISLFSPEFSVTTEHNGNFILLVCGAGGGVDPKSHSRLKKKKNLNTFGKIFLKKD